MGLSHDRYHVLFIFLEGKSLGLWNFISFRILPSAGQTWSLAFKEHHLVGRLGSGLVWTTLDGAISVCSVCGQERPVPNGGDLEGFPQRWPAGLPESLAQGGFGGFCVKACRSRMM